MYLQSLTEEQINKIYKQYNTDSKKLKEDVNDLMEWMEKQPHLPPVKGEFKIFFNIKFRGEL